MDPELEDFFDRNIAHLENLMHWFFLLQLAAAQANVSVEELMNRVAYDA